MIAPHSDLSSIQKNLLFSFIQDFISEKPNNVTFVGFQDGGGTKPDLILFNSTESGSTCLALPAETLFEPREIALAAVAKKIFESRRAFAGRA